MDQSEQKSIKERREFLKQAGKAALAAPAAVVLLSATSVPKQAQAYVLTHDIPR